MKLRLSSLGIVLGILVLGCSSPESTQAPLTSPSSVSTVSENRGQMLPISAKAIMAGQEIQLEVADTPDSQATGLMYRQSLADDRGMLFPFNPPQNVRFWMKNVSISLDMIFVRDGVVKAIAADVPPCTSDPCPTYSPETPIDSVIELRGGRASEIGLKVGDRVIVSKF